jgi:peptidoglycan hydrolase-like amidase
LSQTFLAERVSAEQHPGHVVRLLELGGADHAVKHIALDEVHQLLQIRHVRVKFKGGQKVLHQDVVLRFVRVKSTYVRLLLMMRYYGVSVVEKV